MNSNPFPDPLQTLRATLAEIDREPEPLTPELVLLRELLDNRLAASKPNHNGSLLTSSMPGRVKKEP